MVKEKHEQEKHEQEKYEQEKHGKEKQGDRMDRYIVDFHVHCFPDELAQKAVPVLAERANTPAIIDGTISAVEKSMRQAGISRSVVLSIATKPTQTERITNWSVDIQNGSIITFGSIHPDCKGWKEELGRMKELGLKGIKCHPDYQEFYVDEERMFPVYEEAFKLDMIILFHAGIDIGLPEPYHCTPDRLLKVVKAFPGGRIVAAHMGGYGYWDDVEEYLVGENIYFDTSYSIGFMDDVQAKRIIKNHDYKKILFATDSPWTDQEGEVLKIRSLNLSYEAETAILGENADILLGLGD